MAREQDQQILARMREFVSDDAVSLGKSATGDEQDILQTRKLHVVDGWVCRVALQYSNPKCALPRNIFVTLLC